MHTDRDKQERFVDLHIVAQGRKKDAAGAYYAIASWDSADFDRNLTVETSDNVSQQDM